MCSLHQKEQTETGDGTEGTLKTLKCLQEGDDEEVSYNRACMGELPPGPLGGNHHTGQELLAKEALHIQMTHSEERSTEVED